jgi:maleamate amidohydrolase
MKTDGDEIFERQQFGARMGMGSALGLLIVDFTVGFSDPQAFGGGNIEQAAQSTVELLERARHAGIPIAHTKIIYAEDGSDANVHCLKVPRLKLLTESNPLSDFVPSLMPLAGEIVVRKRLPSAFYGTDLAGRLLYRGVDTLLIAGCTTSGCVRASTLDAMCCGFRPMVIEECVGDRASGPHEASLFDMNKKYADVISRSEALAALKGIRHGGQ